MHACSVAKSRPTLCEPMGCSLSGSSVHGIFQARILEWVAISSSRGSSWPRDWNLISCSGRWVLYHWATREAANLVFLPNSKQEEHRWLALDFRSAGARKNPNQGKLQQELWIKEENLMIWTVVPMRGLPFSGGACGVALSGHSRSFPTTATLRWSSRSFCVWSSPPSVFSPTVYL